MSANEKPDGLEAELARRAREIESRVDAINLAAQPAQAGEAVAWGDINARLRQHVEGIKDQGCANWGDPFSCDKQPNGTRSLRPCEPCLMGRLLERAAFDALFAPSRPGGAAQEQAGEAVGHVHDWDYDCRGSGPFCKLCGVGPSSPGGAE